MNSVCVIMFYMKTAYVYITASFMDSVLYTGVTSNLKARVWQHKTSYYKGSFTSKYKAQKLVYYEAYESIVAAIAREKQIKAGPRWRKVKLIEAMNPEFNDLSLTL